MSRHTEHLSFKGEKIPVTRLRARGMTSEIFLTADGNIIKRLKGNTKATSDPFARQIYWLQRLEASGIVPRLIDSDAATHSLLMEHAGEPLSSANIPSDWRRQLNHITMTLRERHCRHNDLSEEELLVKDGKIRIVDFGHASTGEDMTCGGRFKDIRKNRIFEDRHIPELVELMAGNHFRGSEPHCFVLWEAGERGAVREAIARRFRIVQEITYEPSAIRLLGAHRVDVLTRFYHGRVSQHGEKAVRLFVLFVVFDEHPAYEPRTNAFNGEVSVVNRNTFDLLQELRGGRTSFLHGSDNIQESYDNLEVLTFYDSRIPLKYWEAWRPKFGSFRELFDTLNSEKRLEYVVLRNFDGLLRNETPAVGADVDVLVDDYFTFKRITGAIGYKHKAPRGYKNRGPAYEYGGYKVASRVSIAGSEVSFDIRHVGDEYYDAAWEARMLEARVEKNGVAVLDGAELFYSLLYHALVHKRSLSDAYRVQLTAMAKHLQLLDGTVAAIEEGAAWSILDEFMKQSGYAYVRPKELTVPFNARTRAGISTKDDLNSARKALSRGGLLEARHLLRHVTREEPLNLHGRALAMYVEVRMLFKEVFGAHASVVLSKVKRKADGLAKRIARLFS